MINIIVPCYNEATRMDTKYWKEIINSPNLKHVSFTFIDDGSLDDTLDVIRQFEDSNNVEIMRLERNAGKANAIRHACLCLISRKENLQLFGFIDSDSAFKAQEVIEILSRANVLCAEFDAIFLSRIKMAGTSITRSSVRHIISRVIYSYVAQGWEWAPYDTQCGFKLFQSTFLIDAAFDEPFVTKWFFDIELTVRLTKVLSRPLGIKEVPLMNWREQAGSNVRWYHFLNIVREIRTARKLIKNISSFTKSIQQNESR